MKITDIRATPVSVPLEAPLRHANGCHWGRFVRTIVEIETDSGLVALASAPQLTEADEAAVGFDLDDGAHEAAPMTPVGVTQRRLEGDRNRRRPNIADLYGCHW